MKYMRRRPRRGCTEPRDAGAWLRSDPVALVLDLVLRSQGYRLQPRVTPYTCADGAVSVRFVWRRRAYPVGTVTLNRRLTRSGRGG